MGKPLLEECTFEFSQEGNCMSHKDAVESLEVRCLSDMGIDRTDGKCFYVLKTESWSIDSVQELQELFDRISKSLFSQNQTK